jgi:phosphoglycerol transferase MdoB-like AlkP superfamily enzyme
MRNYLFGLIKVFLYYLFVFFIARSIFIFFNSDSIDLTSETQLFNIFSKSLRLDASAASYLSLIPFIILTLLLFVESKVLSSVNTIYINTTVLIVSLLAIANIALYPYWHSLVNNRAILYLRFPKQALASISIMQLFLYVMGWIVLFLFLRFIYLSWIQEDINKLKRGWYSVIALPLLLLLGAGMRGGFQEIPINESSAYHSTKTGNNHAAVNQLWYLTHHLLQSDANESKDYDFFPEPEAAQILAPAFSKSGQRKQVFKTNRPNIVLMILESMNADVIGALGGEKGLTPVIDSVAKEGILFTHVYSSGFRTDQGIVSIMSGYPAQPGRSIIRIPAKMEKLSFLSADLYETGYSNSFYYGGDSGFDNMNAYLRTGSISQIHDQSSFPKKMQNSKWGAFDEAVFNKMNSNLDAEHQPFFSTILTITQTNGHLYR